MKVLFVCRSNVGRSQAAMELHRLNGGEADSAGTRVDTPNQHLKDRERAKNILEVMKHDYGIDMSSNLRRQLSPEDLGRYDRVIVMSEPESTPDWLKNSPKTINWKVKDPSHEDQPTTSSIVREIKAKVDLLK